MLRLILVRHGETDRNSQMRLQGGRSDTPLNEKGEEQARCLGRALSGESLEAVYCSPLKRAMDTARAISGLHGLEPSPLPGLVELDMGVIDGRNISEIRASQLDFWTRWRAGDYSMSLPGGESLPQLRRRAWEAVRGILQRHPRGTVAAVSHSVALQTVLTAALGAPLESFSRFHVAVAGITILHIDGLRASLVTLNDTCHLA
ncbi:MAG: histidine phosphatase family protein [Chloroflexi bacterium]|nr:histidine phosphatase family protein [Chloroflexota bacterium]